MSVTFPGPSCEVKWKLPGGIHDSRLVSFGRILPPWLGVRTNGAMIRNLSLILEDITESATKALAAQENS